MNAAMIARACSRLSKRWRYTHCSFSVRLNRSITPLHSGSPTYDGEIVIPSQRTSLIHASAMYWGAPVAPEAQPPGEVFREAAERVADALADRLQRRPAVAELGNVPAEQLVGVMVDRPEEPAPALPFGI